MDVETRNEIARMRADILREVQRMIRNVPSRFAEPPADQPMIQIIGGQVINNVPMIQYAADSITPSQFYDPDVDTTYMIGLGYGWLYSLFGRPRSRVLVRHNYIANVDPVIAGDCFVSTGTQTLTYGARDMTAYTIGYA